MSFVEYSRPKRVAGGLRARSARGAIGSSWWSRRFLSVLESFALGTRLTRGRSYARAGQVLSLSVTAGEVTASVQGSRPRPYRVRIGLAPFPAPVWDRVETALAGQALFSAQLLAGEMPPELEPALAECGAPLFPASLSDLTLSCSCPDFAVPCKHLAATFYLLAEAFDADPFQLLRWRGRDREALLARLRELRSGGPGVQDGDGGSAFQDGDGGSAVPAPRVGSRKSSAPKAPTASGDVAAREIGSAPALTDLTATPLADTLERFWLPPVPLPDQPLTLDTEPDLLLRQLPPPGPDLGGEELVDLLRMLYRRFGDGPLTGEVGAAPKG